MLDCDFDLAFPDHPQWGNEKELFWNTPDKNILLTKLVMRDTL